MADYLGSAGCCAFNTNDYISFVFMLCLISMFYSVLILLFSKIFLAPLFSLLSLKPIVNLIPFAFWLNFQTQEYFCVRKPISFLIHLLHP